MISTDIAIALQEKGLNRFQSNIQWPEDLNVSANGGNLTTDLHATHALALNTCKFLENEGLGGERVHLPIKTWVSEISTDNNLDDPDYYAACLSEESGEVVIEAAELIEEATRLILSSGRIVKAVGKSHRFGITDCHPRLKQSNHALIKAEIHDVIACYELLMASIGEEPRIDRNLIQAKKDKIHRLKRSRAQVIPNVMWAD